MKKLLVFLLCSTLVLGDTAGPSSGTATGSGWTSPSNVGASDNAYATKLIGLDGGVSTTLSISSLGFSIPASSTVLGITATLEHKCSGTGSCTTSPSGGLIQLTKVAGVVQGTNKGGTVWTTSDETETLGSATDLWGSTWTYSEVNDAGFGLAVKVVNVSETGNRTASVDYMALTVTYTPSGSGSHRRVVISQTRSAKIHG